MSQIDCCRYTGAGTVKGVLTEWQDCGGNHAPAL